MQKTNGMTIDEIIVRIKDHMRQHSSQIRGAFLRYDRQKKNKVSKRIFRQVIFIAYFEILY